MDLTYKKKNSYKENDVQKIFDYAEGYKQYLAESKTERDAVATSIALAEKAGYVEYDFGKKIEVGGKYFYNNRNKNLLLFKIGTENVEKNGVRIMAAHIDSPRLDLKQVPLYESDDLAFFKTHYYGGVKKYQWTCIPLALHGIVCLRNGEIKNVRIGDEKDDPVFYVSDLLPHLAQKQAEKPLGQALGGEDMNVWVGGMPLDGEEKQSVKKNVLKILNEKYGLTEGDLIKAELTMVPAENPRDVGFDRAQIAAYGHDDKVCAYPALTAQLEENGDHTIITILADKEEIGSEGTTGMQCDVFADILEEICLALGANVRAVKAHSMCLSADVTAAYDPNFPEVFEKANACMLAKGVGVMKFTGSRGKSGSSDACGEYYGKITNMFDDANVLWQSCELGKVDVGGGGTVAKFIAKMNIDTVDIGTAVISMHAPLELISKADLFETYKAFTAFCK